MIENITVPEIKIDCFTIQIQTHKEKGKNGNKENVFIRFDDFYKKTVSNDIGEDIISNQSFISFFADYLNSFQGKFAVNGVGKALHLNSEKIRFQSENRIISGTFEGGTTNIGGFIKEQNNPHDEDSFILTPNHVEGQPYYFIMYFPEDSNMGLLLVQSFSAKSVTDLFKRHLQQFFSKNSENVTLLLNSVVPKEVVKNFREKGVIDKVTLRKQNLDSDRASRVFGYEFSSEDGITIELRIKGLKQLSNAKELLDKMMNGDNLKFFDIPEINELGFDGTHETVFEYEHNGRKSSVKSSKNFSLTPSFYISESDISRDEKLLPTFESLDNYCRSLLVSLCSETSIPTPNVA
jgi:hypothetical protein